ncbi:unnamed protein product [Caenorhabditis brenneri]
MPCLFTGLFTVFYTIFVYFNVLSKKDRDWSLIIAIFCVTWIVVYFLKRLIDYAAPDQNRPTARKNVPTQVIVERVFNGKKEKKVSGDVVQGKQFCV